MLEQKVKSTTKPTNYINPYAVVAMMAMSKYDNTNNSCYSYCITFYFPLIHIIPLLVGFLYY